MNPIKSLILIISILISGLTVTGCSNSAEASNTSDNTTVVPSDTVKSSEGKAIMDTISKLYVQKIAFNDTIQSQKKEISALETKVSDLELYSYISLATAALALILVGLTTFCIGKMKERISRQRNKIRELKDQVDLLSQKIVLQPQPQTHSSNSSKEYINLAGRLRDLEKKVDNKSQEAPASTQVVQQPAKAKATTEEKGFFGIPSQMSDTEGYFKKIIKSGTDSEVRFKATIFDQQRATFEPMTDKGHIASIISSDTMKFAVDTEGVQWGEAKSMTIKPGEAQLRNSRWEITKKAIIHLQ